MQENLPRVSKSFFLPPHLYVALTLPRFAGAGNGEAYAANKIQIAMARLIVDTEVLALALICGPTHRSPRTYFPPMYCHG